MKHRSRLKRNEGIAGLLFVTPSMIYFFVFFLLPLVICIYASFTNWNILSVKRTFVGLRNFEKMFADQKFWTALKNTPYMLIPIPIYTVFALAFAYCCHKKILGEKVFRVIYYLPFISSVVALVLIWKWLFNSQYGLINNFLALFGIEGPDWLGNPVWTKRMIVIMISWKMIGIISIYYIAALKNVPRILRGCRHRWCDILAAVPCHHTSHADPYDVLYRGYGYDRLAPDFCRSAAIRA